MVWQIIILYDNNFTMIMFEKNIYQEVQDCGDFIVLLVVTESLQPLLCH